MNSSGDSFASASSNVSTTVASTPVAANSSRRCSLSVSSCGADSGRTTVAGWRSNVSTTDLALAPTASGGRRR